MKEIIKNHKPLVFLLIVVFITHTLLGAIPPLNGDEAMFWEWSRHLAAGYYAHPPMTAWVVALVVKIFTLSKYTVRLGSILLHLGTIVFVYRLALDISKSRKQAFMASALFVVMPLSVLMGTAMTTDSSLIFFFTVTVYFVRKAIIEDYERGWYYGAIACGGMLLSKFFSVLFFPGVFIFLLVKPAYRKQLATKGPYLACLIALIVFSPFLVWNARNNWLTFQFNLVVRHEGESGFNLLNVPYYIGGQALAASPILFAVVLISLVYFGISKVSRRRGALTSDQLKKLDSYQLLSFIVLFTLLFFLAFSFKVKIGSHWPGIIYPIASVVLSAWILPDVSFGAAYYKRKTYWISLLSAMAISLTVGILVIAPKLLPDKLLYTEKVYQEAPVLSHFFGWREVGVRIDELIGELTPDTGNLILSSSDYAKAAMFGFYTPSHPQFYLMGAGKETVHGKSFLLWAKGVKQIGDNTLFVSDFPKTHVNAVTPYFEKTVQLDPLVIRDKSGRILRVFYFTHGIHYLGNEPVDFSIW